VYFCSIARLSSGIAQCFDTGCRHVEVWVLQENNEVGDRIGESGEEGGAKFRVIEFPDRGGGFGADGRVGVVGEGATKGIPDGLPILPRRIAECLKNLNWQSGAHLWRMV
jgi:hypothetical protein